MYAPSDEDTSVAIAGIIIPVVEPTKENPEVTELKQQVKAQEDIKSKLLSQIEESRGKLTKLYKRFGSYKGANHMMED